MTMLFAVKAGPTEGRFTITEGGARYPEEAITSLLLYAGHMKVTKLVVFQQETVLSAG
jgi:hypothetical protein